MIMSESSTPLLPLPHSKAQIKWAYAMSRVPNLPQTWEQAKGCVRMDSERPCVNNILISQIAQIGRHTRLDLRDTSKSKLFVGDLVGLVLSPRYATGQFQAVIPENLETVHFVCAGGVCGQVSGIPVEMKQPTLLKPMGYLVNEQGQRVELGDHALPVGKPNLQGTQVMCVVGSAMDSGKTTAAFSLINGLVRAGLRVGAAKITGTASAKDLTYFQAAGACRVLDFTHAGYGATADLEPHQLEDVADRILHDLMLDKPDVIVLEIADGVTQRETEILLDLFARKGTLDKMLYTCNDALGVDGGVRRLTQRGLPVCGVSGMVTRSALSTAEARRETTLPIYTRDDLLSPEIATAVFDLSKPIEVIARMTNGVLAG